MRRRPAMLGVALALVAGGYWATPLPRAHAAAVGQTWSEAQPDATAPRDPGASAAFDEATGQLVLAGGESGTWTWDGVTWTQQHPATGPSNRNFQALGYDGATKQVVLFGGNLLRNVPIVPSIDAATDTWTWNGSTWTQQHPTTVPPNGSRNTCAAYDPATGQFLMYDGVYGHPATWNWTGGNWVQVNADAGPLGSCSMAYDPDLHALLRLEANPEAGVDGGMHVWSWDGSKWTLTPMTVPIKQGGAGSIAYDADAGAIVALVNVITSPPPYIWPANEWQTWVLAGGSWSRAVVATPTGSWAYPQIVFDAATHQIVSIYASPGPPPSTPTWIYGSAVTSDVVPTRIFGADRESTAVAVSQSMFPVADTASAAVLARSDAFPDALAGGPLAAAQHGPLLLTPTGSLGVVTSMEIRRVLKPGGTVFLLGGTAALSASVSSAVSTLGFQTVRLAGADRFDTAIAIAGVLNNPATVFEASGANFADAVSAVPAAIAQHGVILLTNGATQPPATSAYLKAHPGTHYAIGGPAALADPSAIALVGADRYATSAQVGRAFFPSATAVFGASALGFSDALAVGPVAGAAGAAVLLLPPTGGLPEPVAAYLQTRDGTATSASVVGGPNAVGDDVLSQVTARLNRG